MLNHLIAFQRVWVRRGIYAIAGILMSVKKGSHSILIFYENIGIERSVNRSDFEFANVNYWDYGVMTRWPVHEKLKSEKGVATQPNDPSNVYILDEIEDEAVALWMPSALTKG
jgi:hypothetical protein